MEMVPATFKESAKSSADKGAKKKEGLGGGGGGVRRRWEEVNDSTHKHTSGRSAESRGRRRREEPARSLADVQAGREDGWEDGREDG